MVFLIILYAEINITKYNYLFYFFKSFFKKKHYFCASLCIIASIDPIINIINHNDQLSFHWVIACDRRTEFMINAIIHIKVDAFISN